MSLSSTAVSPSERTKSEVRTEQLTNRLLDAATKLFMEEGYETTSMGEIARLAHASKETFYRHFPTKEELFRAVVVRRAQWIATELGAALLSSEPPEKALAAFGERVLDRLLTAENIAFHRILITELERFPDLAQSFRTHGPSRVQAALSHYLDEQVAKGRLRPMNTVVGGRQFFDLLAADMMRAAMMFGPAKASQAEIRQRVQEAIDCFLHGYDAN